MAGVIPPIKPGATATGPERSPYSISAPEIVDQYCFSSNRAAILQGYLDLRAKLHATGIEKGVQWVDGSFLENIEDTEGRPPNDIDVVTFAELPPGQTQSSMFPVLQPLLDNSDVKARFKVDHYLIILPHTTLRDICYWNSLWSHRRDGLWKGYAEIDLAPAQDPDAARILRDKVTAGFN